MWEGTLYFKRVLFRFFLQFLICPCWNEEDRRASKIEVACERALHLGESRVSCSAKTFLARTLLPPTFSRSLTARFLESLLGGYIRR